jgi:peptidoglycan/xylan/chitin deacetylase (PgdA/CDA1 family)
VARPALGRSAREAWEVPRDLLLRRYPPFVTGGGLPRGDVPVFVFHEAEHESFPARVAHLARNAYATLSADEHLAVLRGEREPPDRAVVLTFDDGRASVGTIAAPLLERHGMKAVVFLVPGRIPDRPGGALLSWDEVASLAATGLFDFQSHTQTHARVHTSAHLAGFVTPRSRLGYEAFDQPLLREGDRDLLGEEAPLGAPLLRSAPRLSESPRFFEDPAVRERCVAEVAAAGGEGFFLLADWEDRLRRAMRGTRVSGRTETPEERVEAIRRELALSRRTIEERTGRPVRHVCYPWHAEGPTARRLAREAGYEAAWCGKVPGTPISRRGSDPRAIARIGEDWVELLPGEGRRTLAEVLRRKWARRFGGGLR